MYSPKSFQITDQTIIEEFIKANPFATLTSEHNGKIQVTHLPINRLKDGKLYGHVAKANEHASISSTQEVCFIFNGPHAYISPTYYQSSFNVPTWNYSAVHMYGNIHYIDNQDKVWNLLQQTTETYEGKSGWQLPEKKEFQGLTQAIRFFEIKVTRVEAKFKFNQNKSSEDIENVINSLKKSGQIEVSNFMEKVTKK